MAVIHIREDELIADNKPELLDNCLQLVRRLGNGS
jgi:hypothetical protein